MVNQKAKLIISGVVMLAAIGFFLVRVMPARSGSGDQRIITQPATGMIAELDFERFDLQPPARLIPELPRVRSDVESGIRAALAAHRVRAREQLVGLARDRVMLYIDPDFDRYLAHIRQASGREPDVASLTLFGQPLDRERWTRVASASVPAIDPGTAFALRGGENGSWAGGGSILALGCDQGRYSTISMHEPKTDVIHIAWPAELPGVTGSYRGLLVLAFAWDQSRQRWVPHVSGAVIGANDEDLMQRPLWF